MVMKEAWQPIFYMRFFSNLVVEVFHKDYNFEEFMKLSF
jgi:hypothetical protein